MSLIEFKIEFKFAKKTGKIITPEESQSQWVYN